MKPTTSLVVMCMISLFAGTSACKQRSGSLSSTRNQTLNHGVPQIVTLTSDQHALEILSRGPDQSVGILYLAHDNHLYDFSDLSTLMGRAKGNGLSLWGVAETGTPLWDNGIIYYTWASDDITQSDRDLVVDVMRGIEEKVDHHVRFVDTDTLPKSERKRDAVLITRGTERGCAAKVGMSILSVFYLAEWCMEPKIIRHELLHVAGLWHEHQRLDRDKYITVLWDNIRPEARYNMNTMPDRTRNVGSYDYASIMHYRSFGSEKLAIDIDKPVMKPTKLNINNVVIGEAEDLSPGDISAIKELYPQKAQPSSSGGVQVERPSRIKKSVSCNRNVKPFYKVTLNFYENGKIGADLVYEKSIKATLSCDNQNDLVCSGKDATGSYEWVVTALDGKTVSVMLNNKNDAEIEDCR